MNKAIRTVVAAGILLTCLSASAAFHLVEVSEVITGINGDTSLQAVVLRMQADGENSVDGITIQARNAQGTVTNTVFTFPVGASAQIVGLADRRILIATPAFAQRTGLTPDFTFAGGLFAGSGQVTYTGAPDSVSYGNYTGPGAVGTPAVSAPGTDLNSLHRIQNTGDNSADFALFDNSPVNNDGVTGHAGSTVPLRLTEVDTAAGVVEVTNIRQTTYTAQNALPFSYKLNESTSIAAGTEWAPGQSTTFTLAGLDPADSDVWLYLDGNFTSAASIISGVKYGPAPNVGRTSVAVAAGIWPLTTAFVSVPVTPGNSLKILVYGFTLPVNWGEGTPNPGAFFGTGVTTNNPISNTIAQGSVIVGLQPVISGIPSPLGTAVPDDATDRLFVYDQTGKVYVVENGTPLATPFMDVSSRLVPLGLFPPLNYDERGLLGFAMHPQFGANPKVYTHTSEPYTTGAADFTTPVPSTFDHQDVIAEWTVDLGNPNLVNPASRRELLRIDHPSFNHNGGTLRFGPDKMLYFTIGDGGAGNDAGPGHAPDGNAQKITNIFGKIHRINVDGNNSTNGQYGIPTDNPFFNVPGAVREIFAFGLRNPYAFSFDRQTGQLFVGDAGQSAVEEVDVITTGGNYGWRLREGGFFFDPTASRVTTIPVKPIPEDLLDPFTQYDHDDGSVVVAGFVYRGSAIAQLQGRYVTADFGGFAAPTGRLFYTDVTNELLEFNYAGGSLGYWVKGFGEDRNGEILVCLSTTIGPQGTTGLVARLVGPSAAVDWQFYE